jgi:hypothetical protein
VIKPRANRPSPMSNSPLLQEKMDELIEQHPPPLRKTRRRNLALFTAGLSRSGGTWTEKTGLREEKSRRRSSRN